MESFHTGLQAIMTRYVGPTNHHGPRIVARAAAGRRIVPYQEGLGLDANHLRAAEMLARKFGWEGALIGGGLPDGSSVFVQVHDYAIGGNK